MQHLITRYIACGFAYLNVFHVLRSRVKVLSGSDVTSDFVASTVKWTRFDPT